MPTSTTTTACSDYHSKFEWVAVRAMEKAVESAIMIAKVWAEEG
jgi:di/tripeptidase